MYLVNFYPNGIRGREGRPHSGPQWVVHHEDATCIPGTHANRTRVGLRSGEEVRGLIQATAADEDGVLTCQHCWPGGLLTASGWERRS